ncbi:MAG: tetraacyldisaccharide 4'-kinase [Ignavibacteriae bacterium]|nr:MAG: tetraacyldisaccharide 4'-kinase [Ignavibacteriota bacterium]
MRKLLLPFSFIFRVIVLIRNIFYKLNIIKSTKLNAAVISVGNISVGGTGKTPLVEYIAKKLLNKGKFIAIVTKGYKRIHDDIQVAEFNYKDEEHKLTSEHFGDESLNLLENLSGTSSGRGLLVVSDDKRSGAKLADRKFKPDVIIIDDAFQHRKLRRDLDIVVLNHNYKGNMLPAGNLREPVRSLKRADIIIINHKFEETIIKKVKFLNVAECKYVLDSYRDYNNNQPESAINNCTAFCGIGDHVSFHNMLEVNNIEVKHFIKYSDHYNYRAADISAIIKGFKESESDYILTTQKDFVKLKYTDYKSQDFKVINDFIENYPVYYAKIFVEFTKNENILDYRISELLNE